MKALLITLLVAQTALLPAAQRKPEFSYEGVVTDAAKRYIQQSGEEYAFKPLMGHMEVETVSTAESADKPVVVRELRFPLHETVCGRTEDQTSKQCPLKKNGKVFMCKMTVSQQVLVRSIPQNSDITCEPRSPAEEPEHKSRMRRSKSSSGGGKKSSGGGNKGSRGSRSGAGSSIAGRGSGNSNTRTA